MLATLKGRDGVPLNGWLMRTTLWNISGRASAHMAAVTAPAAWLTTQRTER